MLVMKQSEYDEGYINCWNCAGTTFVPATVLHLYNYAVEFVLILKKHNFVNAHSLHKRQSQSAMQAGDVRK